MMHVCLADSCIRPNNSCLSKLDEHHNISFLLAFFQLERIWSWINSSNVFAWGQNPKTRRVVSHWAVCKTTRLRQIQTFHKQIQLCRAERGENLHIYDSVAGAVCCSGIWLTCMWKWMKKATLLSSSRWSSFQIKTSSRSSMKHWRHSTIITPVTLMNESVKRFTRRLHTDGSIRSAWLMWGSWPGVRADRCVWARVTLKADYLRSPGPKEGR